MASLMWVLLGVGLFTAERAEGAERPPDCLYGLGVLCGQKLAQLLDSRVATSSRGNRYTGGRTLMSGR